MTKIYGMEADWSAFACARHPECRVYDAPEDMPDFRGHRLTIRGWWALSNLRWTTRAALMGASARELRLQPNAGRATWGEIARLRATVLRGVPTVGQILLALEDLATHDRGLIEAGVLKPFVELERAEQLLRQVPETQEPAA